MSAKSVAPVWLVACLTGIAVLLATFLIDRYCFELAPSAYLVIVATNVAAVLFGSPGMKGKYQRIVIILAWLLMALLAVLLDKWLI